MDILTKIAQSINIIHVLWYWIALMLLDIGIMGKHALRNKIASTRLLVLLWLPFGVLIPILWILQQPVVVLTELLVILLMCVLYGVVRPIFYHKKIASVKIGAKRNKV